jgi:predicted DNA-binding transcriptional regulator AlpA
MSKKAQKAAPPLRVPDSMLVYREVLEFMKISRATGDRLRAAAEFPPAVRVGHVNRWRRSAVEEWLAARECAR